ncbi:MAG: hypothetical protein KGQ93_12415 [Cyanobacteria bacterium REEB459]|nr:hypothetical protein [Cyanobacteria bacterium REEB459]
MKSLVTHPMNNTPNALMTYSLGFRESILNPGPVTLGMFKDMGWNLAGSPSSTTLAISATNATQTEGNSGTTKAFTFTVTRSGNTTGVNVVGWALTGSGTNPSIASDFAGGVLPTGTLSFAANETTKVITVNVQGDTTVEPDENFTVALSGSTNGTTLTTATATGTILNDDTSFSIAPTNAIETEGNSGTKAFTFTVTRSGNTTGVADVGWAVTGSGTNPANASDFAGGVLPTGTLSFAANETTKVITVNVQGDTTVEPHEDFTVALSGPTNGATLTTATATGAIVDDDLQRVWISFNSDGFTSESPASVGNSKFVLNRTGPTGGSLQVNFTLTGTAVNGVDYASIPTTATFLAGSSTVEIPLVAIDDLVVEESETAFLTLLSGSTYGLGGSTFSSISISDNDWNGTTGNDNYQGDAGNNALNGGAGNDALNGGAGKDILTGGSGNDQFIFTALGDSLIICWF